LKWNEAWNRARPLLENVVRGRIPASEEGVELAYLDWGGEGELVVMHHANGFGAASFALVAAALRDRYRVISFDARGHGDSTPVSAVENADAYQWPRLAADYAAALCGVVEMLGRERVRYALGHSFGGLLTLAAAAAHPGLFEELVLLDPVIHARARVPDPSGVHPGTVLVDAARRRRNVFPSREAAYDHFAGRDLFREFRPEALALYVAEGLAETATGEFALKCHPEVEAAIFSGGGSIDAFELAGQLSARTRLVHATGGNFDRAVYDELSKRIPDADVVSCDAGHLFPMERPDLVLALLDLA
jgi:pimeloyl-ACP methyl ester carboxylesterase